MPPSNRALHPWDDAAPPETPILSARMRVLALSHLTDLTHLTSHSDVLLIISRIALKNVVCFPIRIPAPAQGLI